MKPHYLEISNSPICFVTDKQPFHCDLWDISGSFFKNKSPYLKIHIWKNETNCIPIWSLTLSSLLIEILDADLLVFLVDWVKTFETYRTARTTVFPIKLLYFSISSKVDHLLQQNFVWWLIYDEYTYTSTKIDNSEFARAAGCHTLLWHTGQKNVTYRTSCIQEASLRKNLLQNMLM